MAVFIISSTIDPASTTIKKCLLEKAEWDEVACFQNLPVFRLTSSHDIYLLSISDRKITHEHLDKEIKEKLDISPRQLIYLSRHTSETGRPSLTVHPIGNYGKAEFGGQNKKLVFSSPKLMTHLLRLIKYRKQQSTLEFNVCYEVTHHGPYAETPTLFVEVGSTEKEWIQKKPAIIIAQSLLKLLDSYRYETDFSSDISVCIGVGGGHYAPRFTDVILEKNVAFGHMIPSYQIEAGNINEGMLDQALQKTPNVTAVYLNKKALKKSQVTLYTTWFKQRGYPVVSSRELPSL